MNKIILACLLMLIMCTSICFAGDIYVGAKDGYTIYLRTESISKNYLVYVGKEDAELETEYNLILVPDEDTLEKLKTLTLDNRVAYRIDSFKAEHLYNRVKKEWRTYPSLTQKAEHLCDSTGKVLYNGSYFPGMLYLNNDSVEASINRKAYDATIIFAKDHKDLVKTKVIE